MDAAEHEPPPAETAVPAVTTPTPPVESSAIPEGAPQRLDPRYVPFQRLIGWITTACMSFVALIALVIFWLAGDLPRWANLLLLPVWMALSGGLAWWCYAWPAREYRHTSYLLDEHGIEIKSGVVWRKVMSVPRSRVQHIDVSQGPLERTHGLGRLVIFTAGTDHSRVELPGLNHDVAFALRNRLLPRGSDDAV